MEEKDAGPSPEASRARRRVWSPLREVLPQSQGAWFTSQEPRRSGAPCWEDRQRACREGRLGSHGGLQPERGGMPLTEAPAGPRALSQSQRQRPLPIIHCVA